MLLIKIKNVKKYYEDRLVLDIEDFELGAASEKVENLIGNMKGGVA